MKFYNNFNSLFKAQSGIKADLNVFNRKSNGSKPAESNPKFDDYTDKYMPLVGEGKTDVERMLVAVNRIGHRFNNDGECLNETADYNFYQDEYLREEFYRWLQAGDTDVAEFLEGTDYYDSDASYEDDPDFDPDEDDPDDYDPEERLHERLQDHSLAQEISEDDELFKDWYNTYYDGDASGDNLSYDSEDENWLDASAKIIEQIDPIAGDIVEDLRISDTSTSYAESLKELVDYVAEHLPQYDGFDWKFADIPEDEMKSWFK